MGDIKKKRKLFSRPKKLFDRARMDEENILVKKYGLKNKREIWKAKSAISKFRRRAKELINSEEDERNKFFDKLNKLGMKVKGTSDVLALTEINLFERRLSTILVKKKLANTPKQARQLIVHKHVFVDGAIVNTPSFIVTKNLEDLISIKEKVEKETSKEKVVEKEISEENKEDKE